MQQRQDPVSTFIPEPWKGASSTSNLHCLPLPNSSLPDFHLIQSYVWVNLDCFDSLSPPTSVYHQTLLFLSSVFSLTLILSTPFLCSQPRPHLSHSPSLIPKSSLFFYFVLQFTLTMENYEIENMKFPQTLVYLQKLITISDVITSAFMVICNPVYYHCYLKWSLFPQMILLDSLDLLWKVPLLVSCFLSLFTWSFLPLRSTSQSYTYSGSAFVFFILLGVS